MMKCMILFLVFVQVPAIAVRRVGNGGADAENTVLRMAQYMSSWSQACQENKTLCQAPLLESAVIEFGGSNQPAVACESGKIIIPHSFLYLDDKTAKSDIELATILIKALATCQNKPYRNLAFDFLPLGTQKPGSYAIVFSGDKSDLLFSGRLGFNLHHKFQEQTGCSRYRFLGMKEESFLMQCLEGATYIVGSVRTSESEDFFIRYVSTGNL